MDMECTVSWTGPSTTTGSRSGMTFLAETGSGHTLVMDGAPAGTIGYHRSLDYIVIPVGDEMHVVREAHAEAYCVEAGVKFRMAALIKGALLAGATAELDGVSHALVQDDDVLPEGNTGFSGITATATLREKAIKAIAETRWVPEKGRNRIGAMVEGRPDWVLSRQRAWGVPITLFVDRKTGQYLNDPDVNARIVAAVMAGGVDAWDEEHAQEYLGDAYKLDDYERVTDILDVWFDSGSTHAFVLESGRWPDLLRPEGYTGPHADLYLEGSDQHRGWFQSSLLESVGTRGVAPFKAILTHGFVLDEGGRKMSKSLGNVTAPQEVMTKYGADILRLWVMNSDTAEDLRIGKNILEQQAELYRRLRNTLRWLLGNLAGFEESERVAPAEMPELERWVLHRLTELDARLRKA
eukprot:gene43873-53645_t